MQQAPKKHHFVPECYLKRFIADGKLVTFDIRKVQKGYNEYPRFHTPGKICYYEDYYTINDTLRDGQLDLNHDNFFIEVKALKTLEEKYGDLFDGIVNRRKLRHQELVDICDFIIQLKQRNPYWLHNIIEKYKDEWVDQSLHKVYQKILTSDVPFKNLPREVIESVFANVREKTKNHPTFSKQLQLFGLIQRYTDNSEFNRQYRSALMNCQWFLMTAPEGGPYFITTDNPGFSIGRDNLIYNTKFTDGFFFHLPLSPSHCLIMSDEFKDSYSQSAQAKQIIPGIVSKDIVTNTNNKSLKVLNKLIIAYDRWYVDQIIPLNKPGVVRL
jgi:hypothetical protein